MQFPKHFLWQYNPQGHLFLDIFFLKYICKCGNPLPLFYSLIRLCSLVVQEFYDHLWTVDVDHLAGHKVKLVAAFPLD